MPDKFIKKIVDMPNMEAEVQLCSNDEYFAEGALIELQQASKKVKVIDVGKAERGRKNEGSGPALRVPVFTGRSCLTRVLNPTAQSVFVVNLQDGKELPHPGGLFKR